MLSNAAKSSPYTTNKRAPMISAYCHCCASVFDCSTSEDIRSKAVTAACSGIAGHPLHLPALLLPLIPYRLYVLTTLRAKLSGAVYCYRSCLCVYNGQAGGRCYHDNSKLRASIFTKLGLAVLCPREGSLRRGEFFCLWPLRP